MLAAFDDGQLSFSLALLSLLSFSKYASQTVSLIYQTFFAFDRFNFDSRFAPSHLSGHTASIYLTLGLISGFLVIAGIYFKLYSFRFERPLLASDADRCVHTVCLFVILPFVNPSRLKNGGSFAHLSDREP